MPINPLRNKIYIIPLKDPGRTHTGLIIHEKWEQKVDQGIVKYVGEGANKQTGVKIGDHVFFSGYSGMHVAIQGENPLIVVEEDAIWARWEGSDAVILHPSTDILHWIEEATISLGPIGLPPEQVQRVNEVLRTSLRNFFSKEGLYY